MQAVLARKSLSQPLPDTAAYAPAYNRKLVNCDLTPDPRRKKALEHYVLLLTTPENGEVEVRC